MASTTIVWVAANGIAISVLLWIVLRRAVFATRGMTSLDAASAAQRRVLAPVFRAEAVAALSALIAGLAAAAIACGIGVWWARGYGLPLALAGCIGAVVGLLVHTLLPRPVWRTDERGYAVAELTPRGPTSFARQWVFVLPLASASALVVGLVLAGLLSAADENGLHRLFQRRTLSGWAVESGRVVDVQYGPSSSGPFPGWYYGVPLIVGTVVLVGVVYWSLHRIARAARPATVDLFGADTALRALRTRFVMSASSAALAFQVAGLALIAGTVLRAAHLDPVPTAEIDGVPGVIPVEPGHTLGLVLVVSSLIVAVAAVVLLASSLTTVLTLWAAGRAGNTPGRDSDARAGVTGRGAGTGSRPGPPFGSRAGSGSGSGSRAGLGSGDPTC